MSVPPPKGDALVRVEGLEVVFASGGGLFGAKRPLRAVAGVDLDILRGETLGLVGESGSGKTTLGRATIRLVEPTAGRVLFDGADLASLPAGDLRRLRRRMQIVFQDPYASLDPRMRVLDVVGEGLLIHGLARRRDLADRVAPILERVGLTADDSRKYPHEFSGGQRQRIGIARTLALDPEYLVLDEPVSALDVSVRAQIINLLEDLRRERRLTYLFIAHDLAIVEHAADRVAVMYLGRLVEVAARDALYRAPRHPYTRALLEAVPVPDPARRKDLQAPEGDPPSPIDPPPGCPYHPRCPIAVPECRAAVPPLREVAPGHRAACIKA